MGPDPTCIVTGHCILALHTGIVCFGECFHGDVIGKTAH